MKLNIVLDSSLDSKNICGINNQNLKILILNIMVYYMILMLPLLIMTVLLWKRSASIRVPVGRCGPLL